MFGGGRVFGELERRRSGSMGAVGGGDGHERGQKDGGESERSQPELNLG